MCVSHHISSVKKTYIHVFHPCVWFCSSNQTWPGGTPPPCWTRWGEPGTLPKPWPSWTPPGSPSPSRRPSDWPRWGAAKVAKPNQKQQPPVRALWSCRKAGSGLRISMNPILTRYLLLSCASHQLCVLVLAVCLNASGGPKRHWRPILWKVCKMYVQWKVFPNVLSHAKCGGYCDLVTGCKSPLQLKVSSSMYSAYFQTLRKQKYLHYTKHIT